MEKTTKSYASSFFFNAVISSDWFIWNVATSVYLFNHVWKGALSETPMATDAILFLSRFLMGSMSSVFFINTIDELCSFRMSHFA